ncbi:hypothetical protein ACFPYI_17580 [Halomarina salina]|uniref:Uncharacterized protein n=1 Tax=Halomarina salina TaxID=1872699 RepID=A0ABD5RRK9_9EURY|nr:hypothetical protein [Halomarina salina]
MRLPSPSDLVVVSVLTAFVALTGHLLAGLFAALFLRRDTREWLRERVGRGEQL